MSREESQPTTRDRGTVPPAKPIGSYGASSAPQPSRPETPPVGANSTEGKGSATAAGSTKSADAKSRAAEGSPRLVSLDAFRGFIMLAMASAGFQFGKVFANLQARDVSGDSFEYKFVEFLKNQTDHVPWIGGVFWDLIQPAFMFMVGVALPYSYARRAAGGDSYLMRLLHTLVRSAILVGLGVFLANPTGDNPPTTNFIFPNVLAQIGLGYTFVFLLVNRGLIAQIAAIALICGGTWYAFYQHPLRPDGFDYRTVGIDAPTIKVKEGDVEKVMPNPEFTQFVLPGLFGHWSKNVNFAADADRQLLNRFPRTQRPTRAEKESDSSYAARLAAARTTTSDEARFQFNSGGYTTLNFVPSMATMLLGLIVGEMLRAGYTSGQKLKRLAIIGAISLAVGLVAGFTVCPIIKRIWTPSWTLVSGGLVVWMLGGFYLVFDHWSRRRWAWPLVVVGMNSIAMYMLSQLTKGWTLSMLKTHLSYPYAKLVGWLGAQTGWSLNPVLFGSGSNPYAPMWESAAVLFCFWLVCAWLWRQKIFVRI